MIAIPTVAKKLLKEGEKRFKSRLQAFVQINEDPKNPDRNIVAYTPLCDNQRYQYLEGILARITANEDVSNDMKLLANRLLHVYLPALSACINVSEDVAEHYVARINSNIQLIGEDIMEGVESCLVSIEHGAQFNDNFHSAFTNSLLEFRERIHCGNFFD